MLGSCRGCMLTTCHSLDIWWPALSAELRGLATESAEVGRATLPPGCLCCLINHAGWASPALSEAAVALPGPRPGALHMLCCLPSDQGHAVLCRRCWHSKPQAWHKSTYVAAMKRTCLGLEAHAGMLMISAAVTLTLCALPAGA